VRYDHNLFAPTGDLGSISEIFQVRIRFSSLNENRSNIRKKNRSNSRNSSHE
jgi:hypothetical protein